MRVTNPKPGEPIYLVVTSKGPRYRVVLDVAAKGEPRKQQTRTFASLSEARAHVTRHRADRQSGDYVAPTVETVEELCTRWLVSRRDIRPVTVEGYRNALAPVLRKVGNKKVQALSVADVESLTNWLSREGGKRGQGLGPRSVKASLAPLAQALDLAAREDAVTRNVARFARRPRVRTAAGTDLPHWLPAELLTFRDHADTDALAAAWRLTLCGMTRADVLGLRWSDFDFTEGIARVSQGRVALNHGHHTDDPKSAQRVRAVPVEVIHPGTVTLLRALSARQAADRLKLGSDYRDSGLVVVNALGEPLRPEVYSDRFRRLCKVAGVPPITLHSVRHSLAFWLHKLGVSPADAAALLGHTVEVHLSTYLPHSGASGITSAAQALGRASSER